MFDKLKRRLFGAVYNGPETPEYPENQRITPVPVPDDPKMGYVYAGPDPFVRVDGPAYPENQTMGIMAPEEPALPVYAGPPVPTGEEPADPKYIPPTMGLPAPPPPNKGYIRLDHPKYRQQLEFTVLGIGRTLSQFPVPQEFQPTISREHCFLFYHSGDDYFNVVDKNSTNGIFSRDMVWEADGHFAIGSHAFDIVEKVYFKGSNCRWQKFGHRLPAGEGVYVSPGTSLRIGTMDVVLWSEANPERWG